MNIRLCRTDATLSNSKNIWMGYKISWSNAKSGLHREFLLRSSIVNSPEVMKEMRHALNGSEHEVKEVMAIYLYIFK